MLRNLIKTIIIFILLVNSSFTTFSQSGFQNIYRFNATSNIKQVLPISSNRLFICGTLVGNGVFLMKADSLGNPIWLKQAVFQNETYPSSFSLCSDGGLIMSGYTRDNFFQNNMFMAKFDSSGNYMWGRSFGGTGSDIGYSAIQTADGGYAICGIYNASGSQNRLALVKTNAQGVVLWEASYADTNNISLNAASCLTEYNGGFLITGYRQVITAMNDLDGVILKTGTAGNLVWGKSFGLSGTDNFQNVKIGSDGNYIITGWVDLGTTSTDRQVLLVKMNPSGTILWSKAYGSTGDDIGYTLENTPDGGYFIGARTTSFSIGWSVYALKTNMDGNVEWTNAYGSTGEEQTYCSALLPGGKYILGGSTLSFGAFSDMGYLLKLDQNGRSGCNEILTSTAATPCSLTNTQNAWNYYSDAGTDSVISCNVISVTTTRTQLCLWNSINEQTLLSDIRVFPNPVKDVLHVEMEKWNTISDVKIFNAMGQLMYSNSFQGKDFDLTTTDWKSGVYLLQLSNEFGSVSQRIVKD